MRNETPLGLSNSEIFACLQSLLSLCKQDTKIVSSQLCNKRIEKIQIISTFKKNLFSIFLAFNILINEDKWIQDI